MARQAQKILLLLALLALPVSANADSPYCAGLRAKARYICNWSGSTSPECQEALADYRLCKGLS